MVATQVSREQVLSWLSEVADPEIPVLTITDLGIVRDVECADGVTVSLTPTYSGCPATEAIEASVVAALADRGVEDVRIRRVLSRIRRCTSAGSAVSAKSKVMPKRFSTVVQRR